MAVTYDIAINRYVVEYTEPRVEIDSNGHEALDEVVVNASSVARTLYIDTFFVAVENAIVSNFEIGSAANAQRFVRRCALVGNERGCKIKAVCARDRVP